MVKYEFKSSFAKEIQNYINDKSSAGFKGEKYRAALISFDKFCIEQKIISLNFTIEHASKWLEKKINESDRTHYARINASKLFLIYLSLKGYEVHVIRDIKHKPSKFQPYIYTEEDVKKYFMAIDTYSNSINRKDAIQYPILFRILYCCGTRINETLGIRKKDIDFNKGIIILNETKNNNQRCIVLSDELNELLKEYANKCFYLLKDKDYIFTNRNGGRLSEKSVYERHREFLLKANIPYLGSGKGPRIHDWRHHMAVYSFKQLIDSGIDIYTALPIISTYLGHRTIFATEKYVRLTLQLFPYIEEKFNPIVNKIFGNYAEEGDCNEKH